MALLFYSITHQACQVKRSGCKPKTHPNLAIRQPLFSFSISFGLVTICCSVLNANNPHFARSALAISHSWNNQELSKYYDLLGTCTSNVAAKCHRFEQTVVSFNAPFFLSPSPQPVRADGCYFLSLVSLRLLPVRRELFLPTLSKCLLIGFPPPQYCRVLNLIN